jgi:hypothetical protein
MADIAFRPAPADDAEFFFALHKLSLGPYVDQIWRWDDDEQSAYLATHLVLECVRVIVVDGVDAGRLEVEERDDEVFRRRQARGAQRPRRQQSGVSAVPQARFHRGLA